VVATEKAAPILVAAFPTEEQLWSSVRALEENRIGRDFIGVLVGQDGFRPGVGSVLCLASVLAPFRLHEQIRTTFVEAGALAVGDPREMASRFGHIPHPGVIDAHNLKLGMGDEYWQAVARRRNGKDGRNGKR